MYYCTTWKNRALGYLVSLLFFLLIDVLSFFFMLTLACLFVVFSIWKVSLNLFSLVQFRFNRFHSLT